MAIVIPFEDVVRARRQRHERETLQRCIELIRLNLHYTEALLELAPPEDRPIHAERAEQLGSLLAYAVRIA